MSREEVGDILGPAITLDYGSITCDLTPRCWETGPNLVCVGFVNGKVVGKEGHFATAWETLQWYAKKGAEKIGVKWD
jgi:hypothetical protein